MMKLWEVLIEVGQADSAADTNPVDDLLLVGTEARTDQCIKPSAAIAEKSAKSPLDQQTANRFIAQSVLRKWEEEEQIRGRKDPILEGQLQVLIKTRANLMQ